MVKTSFPFKLPREPRLEFLSVNLLPSPFEYPVIRRGTGSAECIFRVQGVAWSQETASLASPRCLTATEKKSLSIASMLFFFP
ncbi:MAG: hypothetical protein OK413_01460, partial [Thaumarchaeota archaeon]|nr:hypothetical protein [Nitrososphaerota archaeon]